MFAVACDAGKRHTQQTVGPLVRILGTNVDTNGAIPADGVIQVSFDRYLLPATITRQSYLILDGTNQPTMVGLPLRTVYDPIARTVTIIGPDGPGRPWLIENQSYKLFLPVAPDPASDIGGFRSIDRAPLLDDQSREIVFRAGPPAGVTEFEPPVDFCGDVFPIFAAKCSSGICHGANPNARASLVLGSANGVLVTAVGRVAQGANTSARAYVPDPPQRLFGVNMAIISPGDPGSSWLMYKLELARQPAIVSEAGVPTYLCTPPPGAPAIPPPAADYATLAPAQTQAGDVDLEVLRDLVPGREMPYPLPGSVDYESQPLTFQEREKIRIWIARGAETRECGGCGRQ